MTIFDDICTLMEPLDRWGRKCHAASFHIVNSGVIPSSCRVARGSHPGVLGQHSWVVIGMDVYNPSGIVDPTLWSYDERVRNIVYTTGADMGNWRPHGSGLVWDTGRPQSCVLADAITLTPEEPLSREAREFLRLLGPLDRRGWAHLVHGGMEGWPSGEIIAAMKDTETVSALVPVDIEGMVTLRNPGALYLPESVTA